MYGKCSGGSQELPNKANLNITPLILEVIEPILADGFFGKGKCLNKIKKPLTLTVGRPPYKCMIKCSIFWVVPEQTEPNNGRFWGLDVFC